MAPGAKWDAVGGVVLGIFFPPSIIAATVGTAAVGGVLGEVRQEWHKSEVGDALSGTLGPNQSGILALTRAGDVEAVKAEMPPGPRRPVERRVRLAEDLERGVGPTVDDDGRAFVPAMPFAPGVLLTRFGQRDLVLTISEPLDRVHPGRGMEQATEPIDARLDAHRVRAGLDAA